MSADPTPANVAGENATIRDLRTRVAAIMESDIYPAEETFSRLGARSERARTDGRHPAEGQSGRPLGAAPQSRSGRSRYRLHALCLPLRIIGRSLIAPEAFNTQAPDAGNMEILWQFGTPEQKSRFLDPLVRSDVRSAIR